MAANDLFEKRVCISGVGQSDVGRRLNRDPLELTLDACLAANPPADIRDLVQGMNNEIAAELAASATTAP